MLTAAVLALLASGPTTSPEASPAAGPRVHALRIQVLSTMLSDEGIGEWGFGALVEVDGHRILFDTGFHPTNVLDNARELRVDLAQVPGVVLSHNHSDHTGGLLTLRRAVKDDHPDALRRVHVGRGLFWSRPAADGSEANLPLRERDNYAAAGLVFVEHDAPQQILPGVWLTGPVP
ncbi:MAG: MBL fold metallo-hydrolase, partial [Acidobacteria bacterium]